MSGPWLQVAVFCHGFTTTENNDIWPIGVLHEFWMRRPAGTRPGSAWSQPFKCSMYVGLTADGATGIHQLRLSLSKPDGTCIAESPGPVEFDDGPFVGVQWPIEFDAPSEWPGTWWGTVELDQQVISRIPLVLRVED